MGVDEQGQVVGPIAEEGEPLRMAHDDVEFVAMNDEVAFAVSRCMDRAALDLDPAEGQAEELTGELIVVAGNEHHPRAPADLAQQFLDDIVMRLRPVPAGAETPAVDDVADQIDRVGLDMAEHVQDEMGLAAARAQVQIREKKRPVSMRRMGLGHESASRGERTNDSD